MPTIEPFIRWAGGKSWFVPYLRTLISDLEINHYHEPFLGGAAVYLALDHKKKSYLSDSNEELINTYIEIKNHPRQVIQILDTYTNTKEEYYRVRALHLDDPIEKAARFIFLNQTSYNGLYRVNRSGDYNVPYGFRKKWGDYERRIIAASEKLENADLKCGDFEINKWQIKKNDLIFLDPPYTVSHNHNGFIQYNRKLFSLKDQERLCQFVDYIKRKDAYYILTNAAHEKIKEIFGKEDPPVSLSRNCLIGGKNAIREKKEEYIFTNIH